MSLFAIWFWLMVGNVAYQVLGHHNWAEAFDRSFFQAIALGGVWFAAKVRAHSLHNRG